jgi:spore coat protein U-like protein
MPEGGRGQLNHAACNVRFNKFVFDGNTKIMSTTNVSQHNRMNSIKILCKGSDALGCAMSEWLLEGKRHVRQKLSEQRKKFRYTLFWDMTPHQWIIGSQCFKITTLSQNFGNQLTSDAGSYARRMNTSSTLLQQPTDLQKNLYGQNKIKVSMG